MAEPETVAQEIQQWDRQSNESRQAYLGFRTFLELGSNRTVDAAYRTVTGQQESGTRAPRRWWTWHKDFTWRDRVEAYDRMLARQEDETRQQADQERAALFAERRSEQREKEYQLAEQLLARLREMLDWPLERRTTEDEVVKRDHKGRPTTIKRTITVEPAGWDWRAVPKAAEVFSKLARQAVDMETGRLVLQNPDGTPLGQGGRPSGRDLTERLRSALAVAGPEKRQQLVEAAERMMGGKRDLMRLLEMDLEVEG